MTTQQLPGPPPAGQTVPTVLAGLPAAPATPPTSTSTRKPKAPTWQAKPQVTAVVVLVLVLILALAVGLLGWVWALVGLGALIAVGFSATQAWRRKGKGGLLDQLLRRRSRPGSNPRGNGVGTGGQGGGLWPGLGGRRTQSLGQSGSDSGRKPGRLAGLRARLPRALGGSPSGRTRKRKCFRAEAEDRKRAGRNFRLHFRAEVVALPEAEAGRKYGRKHGRRKCHPEAVVHLEPEEDGRKFRDHRNQPERKRRRDEEAATPGDDGRRQSQPAQLA